MSLNSKKLLRYAARVSEINTLCVRYIRFIEYGEYRKSTAVFFGP